MFNKLGVEIIFLFCVIFMCVVLMSGKCKREDVNDEVGMNVRVKDEVEDLDVELLDISEYEVFDIDFLLEFEDMEVSF